MFNQPIGSWYTSHVKNMSHMFRDASSFNQPLGSWTLTSGIDTSDMFHGAAAFDLPTCRTGSALAGNGLGCEPCPAGHFAKAGWGYCEACGKGTIPDIHGDSCQDCPPGTVSAPDACHPCQLPHIVYDDACAWWPLTVVTLGSIAVLVAARLLVSFHRSRRDGKLKSALVAGQEIPTGRPLFG